MHRRVEIGFAVVATKGSVYIQTQLCAVYATFFLDSRRNCYLHLLWCYIPPIGFQFHSLLYVLVRLDLLTQLARCPGLQRSLMGTHGVQETLQAKSRHLRRRQQYSEVSYIDLIVSFACLHDEYDAVKHRFLPMS